MRLASLLTMNPMQIKHLSLALAACCSLAACGDDEDTTAAEQDVLLTFAATVNGTPAACGTTYEHLGTSHATAQLADARMFISEIQLQADGEWYDIALDDSIWQNQGVALLDFEDASAACADSGTTDMNNVVTGVVPGGDYDAVRFRLGLPFALNHVDATNAAPPFNVPGMFWVWQGGFKFLRVDWAVDGGELARWNVHIGSTACEAAAPTVAPENPCAQPNTDVLEFAIGGTTDTINVDLAALIAGADININTEDTAPGCMSGATEPAECAPVFSAVGLDFDTGACDAECVGQSVFASPAVQ